MSKSGKRQLLVTWVLIFSCDQVQLGLHQLTSSFFVYIHFSSFTSQSRSNWMFHCTKAFRCRGAKRKIITDTMTKNNPVKGDETYVQIFKCNIYLFLIMWYKQLLRKYFFLPDQSVTSLFVSHIPNYFFLSLKIHQTFSKDMNALNIF